MDAVSSIDAHTLVVLAAAAFGLAYVVGHARISDGLRDWIASVPGGPAQWTVKLLECPGCVGWWTGFAWALARGMGWRMAVLLGFATCGSNTFLALQCGLVRRAGPYDSTPRQEESPL